MPRPRKRPSMLNATSMLLMPVALAAGMPVPPPEKVEGKCDCMSPSRALENSRDKSSEYCRFSEVVGGAVAGGPTEDRAFARSNAIRGRRPRGRTSSCRGAWVALDGRSSRIVGFLLDRSCGAAHEQPEWV